LTLSLKLLFSRAVHGNLPAFSWNYYCFSLQPSAFQPSAFAFPLVTGPRAAFS